MVRTRSQKKPISISKIMNNTVGKFFAEGLSKKVPQHIINKKKFYQTMNDWGLGVYYEFHFDPDRRWRFDVAFPYYKIAVEIEGGTWSGGRHNSGAGFKKDAEKYNTAASKGWLVLRATTADLVNDDFLCLLFDTLVHKKAIIPTFHGLADFVEKTATYQGVGRGCF